MCHAFISCYRNHYNEKCGWGIVRVLSPALALSPQFPPQQQEESANLSFSRRCPHKLSDSTCRGGVLATASLALAATVAAGQEGDEDVQERDDAVDDGGQDGTDSVHNGHQHAADGLEHALNLNAGEARISLDSFA